MPSGSLFTPSRSIRGQQDGTRRTQSSAEVAENSFSRRSLVTCPVDRSSHLPGASGATRGDAENAKLRRGRREFLQSKKPCYMPSGSLFTSSRSIRGNKMGRGERKVPQRSQRIPSSRRSLSHGLRGVLHLLPEYQGATRWDAENAKPRRGRRESHQSK